MSWTDAVLWSLGRGITVSLLGTLIATICDRVLQGLEGTTRRVVWGLLLAPFFVPSLITGYCYRDTSMSLVQSPWLRELLYAAIVMMQSLPVAVVLLAFSPQPAVSDSAWHCRHNIVSKWPRWRLWLGTRVQYQLVAFCLLFLLAFQEADLASLMQASGWSEWMFSRHVRGLSLTTTTRLALIPVAISIPFLVPIVVWLTSLDRGGNNVVHRSRKNRLLERGFVAVWMLFALLLVLIFPVWQMAKGVSVGLGSLASQPSLIREIGDALLISATTTMGLATAVIGLHQLQRFRVSRQFVRLVLFLVLVPGSIGNLALGVIVAGIFQTSALNFAYDTPVPLILSEVAFLLPKALILLHCMNRVTRPTSVYQVTLLERSSESIQRRSARELRWQMDGRIWLAIVSILSLWSYFEVLLPSILAMPGLSPVGLVLYNNLHYGRIAALGSKLALTMMVPLLLVCGFLVLRRFLSRLLPV